MLVQYRWTSRKEQIMIIRITWQLLGDTEIHAISYQDTSIVDTLDRWQEEQHLSLDDLQWIKTEVQQ